MPIITIEEFTFSYILTHIVNKSFKVWIFSSELKRTQIISIFILDNKLYVIENHQPMLILKMISKNFEHLLA